MHDIALALRTNLSLLWRKLKQTPGPGDLTLPERSALARLERGGPATAAALARQEQISPQSIGATIAVLHERDLIERRPDPTDGRRHVLSISKTGRELLHQRRTERTEAFARVLEAQFSREELEVLSEAGALLARLAENI